jgi:serine-type D-Ala-D-Ala carboxypeptidase/endopeptidase
MRHHRTRRIRGRSRLARAILLQVALLCPAVGAAALQIPDSVIANARARVDPGWTPGVVIGVVDINGPRFFSYGLTARDGAPVNERTIFEIGSVTKVFTSLALSEMAVRGDVSLDEPVQSLLPDGVRMPQFGERSVTLRHLALHICPDCRSSRPISATATLGIRATRTMPHDCSAS